MCRLTERIVTIERDEVIPAEYGEGNHPLWWVVPGIEILVRLTLCVTC